MVLAVPSQFQAAVRHGEGRLAYERCLTERQSIPFFERGHPARSQLRRGLLA